jgi:hypothetical protein
METSIVAAADAMPAVKCAFAPTCGEFKGVRPFGQQVKHLAATNHILAAAALGQEPPADAGDEAGRDGKRSAFCRESDKTRPVAERDVSRPHAPISAELRETVAIPPAGSEKSRHHAEANQVADLAADADEKRRRSPFEEAISLQRPRERLLSRRAAGNVARRSLVRYPLHVASSRARS